MTNEPTPSPTAQRFAAGAAILCWATLVLQLCLSIRIATTAGQSAAWGVFMYLGYFTILTNMLVAMALTAAATGAQASPWPFFRRPGVATAIAANIAVVGLTYFFILRHIWNPQGLVWLADVLLHYAMPLIYLAFWWIAVPGRGLRWGAIPAWWIYPLAYLAYALVRGAIAGVYPYAFIDANALGYPRAGVHAAALLLLFTLIAAVLVVIGRIKPSPKKV